MTVTVKVIADSFSQHSGRLVTLECEYPRNIHSEVKTHRVFSGNSSSSRAVPLKRVHQKIRANPALPEKWTMNEPGMQGYTLADPTIVSRAMEIIQQHREFSINTAEALADLGLHKQIFNRYTEAHQHIKTVLTSRQWDNFDWLRLHHTADPTMQALAHAIYDAREASTPEHLQPGEWHLPYITAEDTARVMLIPDRKFDLIGYLTRMSAARCARVSYNNFDGKQTTIEEDIALYDKLVTREEMEFPDPIHTSPTEHQATPDNFLPRVLQWQHPETHGNLPGWIQFRKLIPNENMEGITWQSQN